LSSVPKKFLRSLCSTLGLSSKNKRGFSSNLGGHLLGLSVTYVRDVYRKVKGASWTPIAPSGRLADEDIDGGSPWSGGLPPSSAEQALRNSVRVALSNLVDGNSHRKFCQEMQRAWLAGAAVDLANTSVEFSKTVLAFSSLVLAQMDAEDFNGTLPGLGIPTDIGVLADPVSLGVGVRARHDVLCVICLCAASRWTGRLYLPMHSAPAMPFGAHGGQSLSDLLVRSLSDHPARWGLRDLRSRCAVVCGDGGLCEGGVEHRHSSTAAAEKNWKQLYPDCSADGINESAPLCTVWDPFHRIDVAAWRAIRSVPLAVKVFDASKEIDHLMGQADGVLLFRGVKELLGESAGVVRAPGGTRKVGHLSGTPGSILENFKAISRDSTGLVCAPSTHMHTHTHTIVHSHVCMRAQTCASMHRQAHMHEYRCRHRGVQSTSSRCAIPSEVITATLHARVAWVQGNHRHYSLSHLMSLSKSLTDLSFVVFACIFSDVLKLGLRPFVLKVQGVMEPATFQLAQQNTMRRLRLALQMIPRARGFFRVVALLRQHVPPADLRNLVNAFRVSVMGKVFPTLFDAACDLANARPHFEGRCPVKCGGAPMLRHIRREGFVGRPFFPCELFWFVFEVAYRLLRFINPSTNCMRCPTKRQTIARASLEQKSLRPTRQINPSVGLCFGAGSPTQSQVQHGSPPPPAGPAGALLFTSSTSYLFTRACGIESSTLVCTGGGCVHLSRAARPCGGGWGTMDHFSALAIVGAELTLPHKSDLATKMCLGPTCQCESRVRRAWALHRSPAACPPTERSPVYVQFKGEEAGRYRGHGPCKCSPQSSCNGPCEGLLSTAPRFVIRPRLPKFPPRFSGARCFRKVWTHEVLSVCQVSHDAYIAHDCIDEALVEAGKLISALISELDQVLHRVGVNDCMGHLLNMSAVCFDWNTLVHKAPTAKHVTAFRDVCKRLGPCLQNTLYPTGPGFAGVEREWPSIDNLCAQYVWLTRRVRAAMWASRISSGLDRLEAPEGAARRLDVPADVQDLRTRYVGLANVRKLSAWVGLPALEAGSPRQAPGPGLGFVWRSGLQGR
jgi:hypothetical protein